MDAVAIDVTIVAHVFDVAHELGIMPVDRVLEPAVLSARGPALTSLLSGRLQLRAGGEGLTGGDWSLPEALPERQSLRWHIRYHLDRAAARVEVRTTLFPYDPQHQTFVNIYEGDVLMTQAILDKRRAGVEYFAGNQQGTLAVIGKFLPAGIHHILIGPDHLLFLVGLLLLGGSLRKLIVVVSAFTVAHSITLSLATLHLFNMPARLVEPAIALTIVVVGVDNLMVRGGRDLRAWLAFAFGLVHGFGFANVLREMDLPARALGWSLFSFNVGVEIGQLCVVVVVATAFAALRARNETAGRRLAFAGSLMVIATGAFWFIERIFVPGGIA